MSDHYNGKNTAMSSIQGSRFQIIHNGRNPSPLHYGQRHIPTNAQTTLNQAATDHLQLDSQHDSNQHAAHTGNTNTLHFAGSSLGRRGDVESHKGNETQLFSNVVSVDHDLDVDVIPDRLSRPSQRHEPTGPLLSISSEPSESSEDSQSSRLASVTGIRLGDGSGGVAAPGAPNASGGVPAGVPGGALEDLAGDVPVDGSVRCKRSGICEAEEGGQKCHEGAISSVREQECMWLVHALLQSVTNAATV